MRSLAGIAAALGLMISGSGAKPQQGSPVRDKHRKPNRSRPPLQSLAIPSGPRPTGRGKRQRVKARNECRRKRGRPTRGRFQKKQQRRRNFNG